ncbi:MAG: CDP-glucose 4,6-dehydratase [Bacteroidota bacterium]
MESLGMTEVLLRSFQGKRVLVTGDTGFKGSWLAIWLKLLGGKVFGYALPPLTKRDNYVVTKLSEKIDHQDGDIRDRQALKQYMDSVKPDIVFHLAAQPLVVESYHDPAYTFETNVIGTVNILESIRECSSVQVAINVTTDKVYQNKEWVWGYRENDPLGGKDPYSASKACSDLITSSYIHSYFTDGHCKIASARAGNVIGAGDWADNRIIPDFFRAKLGRKKLVLRNPEATRPWQHVLEPLSGYLLLAAQLLNDGEFVGAWNFGPKDDMNFTVRDLVNQMLELEPAIEIDINKSDTLHEATLLKLDISKAVSILGWKPSLSFKETIDLTVRGYGVDMSDGDSYKNRIESIEKYMNYASDDSIHIKDIL